jgi:hypothetical protein
VLAGRTDEAARFDANGAVSVDGDLNHRHRRDLREWGSVKMAFTDRARLRQRSPRGSNRR